MGFKRARTEDQVDIRLKSIREAAAALYDKEGQEGVGFAQVADRTGLTRPALYSYYSNRYDLILDLLTEEFKTLNRSLYAKLEDLNADEADAASFAQVLTEEITAHRRFTSLLLYNCGILTSQASEKIAEQFRSCSLEFSQLLASKVQRLNSRISSAEARQYAAAVFSVVIGCYALCSRENTVVSAYTCADKAESHSAYEDELLFVLSLLTAGVLMKNRELPTIKQAFSKVLNLDSFL